ncbi:hypothetical protein [Peristeroidobacter soli]|jgi:hypothetical protein|uniref:hypothetical protein n=1 Tax=Peristeroidobacter soli TaxID=2497877 RepID=UPI001300AC15|nr:hypothetical protein [Peristeroidobacter soli]
MRRAATPWLLGRWVLSALLNLVHKLIDCGAFENAIPLRCVVASTRIELLEEARHAHRSERFNKRLNACLSQLRQSRFAAINNIYYGVHGAITSEYHFAGFSTRNAILSWRTRPMTKSADKTPEAPGWHVGAFALDLLEAHYTIFKATRDDLRTEEHSKVADVVGQYVHGKH